MSQNALPATFAELSLPEPLQAALRNVGYEQPSPIQAMAIPHLLAGKDLLGTAQTGTGKTAAFALPLLARLDLSKRSPQALVLTPTRELAIQVAEAFKTYASQMPQFRVLPIYGGQGMAMQLKQLQSGVHVVVGTPGRIMDHLRRKTLKLDDLKTVVLDEADEMLRMGFIEDVTWILDHTPANRQVALFSATMPPPIRKMANQYLNDPQVVNIAATESNMISIEQYAWLVAGASKLEAMTRILEVEEFDGVITFVRTKNATVELAEKLEARGYRSAAINGDMTQVLRERTIEQLKSGKVDIVVATDVAARGIDVARVSHVINYDIPYDTEAYTHRIGRTGRAGRSGKAILFVAPRERRMLRSIEKATKQPIAWLDLPTREQVNLKRIDQFKQSISATLERENLDFFEGLMESFLSETQADPVRVASALAFMAQAGKPLLPPSRGKRDETSVVAGEREPAKRGAPRSEPTLKPEEVDMETFRIAVGKSHGATTGDIVGAIANEAGIESPYIGRIKMYEDYSTVDLPSGMPNDLLQHMRKVRVRQQPMMLERDQSARGASDFKPKGKPKGKPKTGGKPRKPNAGKKPPAGNSVPRKRKNPGRDS